MITLKIFMECINYKVCDGYEYLWKCFGDNSRAISWDSSGDRVPADTSSVTAIFSSLDQTVFEITVWDGLRDKEYRWINPDYVSSYRAEAKSRKIKYRQSVDNRKFIDLEVEADILEKVSAVVAGEEYDARVMIPLDLDDETEMLLYRQAHLADMTVNNFVESLLRKAIEIAEQKVSK